MKLKLLAVLAVALMVGLAWTGTASAHEPTVTLTPEQSQPGEEVMVEGEHFSADAEIMISTNDLAEPLATARTDADGQFEVHFELPHEMPAGVHEMMVMDGEGEMAVAEMIVAGAGGAVATITDTQFDQELIDRIPSTYESAEIFVEGTIAAALPIVWLLMLALHLARPYMLNVLQKFSLRLGADIWWLVYLGARDLLVVVGFLLSGIFLLPHILEMTELPITGSVTAAILFLVLVIKLTRDVDEDRVALLAVSYLLAIGAAIYIATFLLGVMGQDVITGGPMEDISDGLVTTSNLDTARYLSYGSLAAISASGLYALYYNLSIAARRGPKATASQ
jgi:hypothetical protein